MHTTYHRSGVAAHINYMEHGIAREYMAYLLDVVGLLGDVEKTGIYFWPSEDTYFVRTITTAGETGGQ